MSEMPEYQIQGPIVYLNDGTYEWLWAENVLIKYSPKLLIKYSPKRGYWFVEYDNISLGDAVENIMNVEHGPTSLTIRNLLETIPREAEDLIIKTLKRSRQ